MTREKPREVKALAFLQNQWVRDPQRDPQRVRAQIARHGENWRRRFVSWSLFAGCLTGRRLKAAFGELVYDIAWDNVSPKIGGKATDVFAADPEHMRRQIAFHKPEIILAFGKVAGDAMEAYFNLGNPLVLTIYGPHPAARRGDIMHLLEGMADEYRLTISCVRGEMSNDEYLGAIGDGPLERKERE